MSKIKPEPLKGKITSKQLHEWYLEATKKLKPESFNPKAQKSYNKLTKEQKFIDEFIMKKIKEVNKSAVEWLIIDAKKKSFKPLHKPLSIEIYKLRNILSEAFEDVMQ